MAPDEGTKPVIIGICNIPGVGQALALAALYEAAQSAGIFDSTQLGLPDMGISASEAGQCLRELMIPEFKALHIKDDFSDFEKKTLGLGETVPVKEFFVVVLVILIIELRIRSPGALKSMKKYDLQKT